MNLHEGLERLARWTSQHLDSHGPVPAALAPRPVDSERLHTLFGTARLIRQMRIRAGLSQQELAARLQLSVPEMVAIEIGRADCLTTLRVSENVRRLVG